MRKTTDKKGHGMVGGVIVTVLVVGFMLLMLAALIQALGPIIPFLGELGAAFGVMLFYIGAIAAVGIGVVVALNAAVGVLQEGKARKALESLKKLTSPKAFVIREGRRMEIPAAELVRGADLLYHEATYAAAERKVARQRGHSTTEEAAKAALRAEAGRLIIGHYSSRYKDEQVLVDEARELFPETYPAVEGSTFTIEKRRPDSGADKNR